MGHEISVRELGAARLAGVLHRGDYRKLGTSFERLRDGFEDFEKIRLLRETAAKTGKTAALADLERVLSGFTRERSGKSGDHADDVRAANDAIDRAVGLLKP